MNKILCFGDSNTWGYDPVTKGRFSHTVRWTGLLKDRLANLNIEVLEEGLCGRTTIFEDEFRPGRKGIDSLNQLFPLHTKNTQNSIDSAVLMLGTNDCKTYNHASEKEIGKGIEDCLLILKRQIPVKNILLLSPIHLGDEVYQDTFDPEFNQTSIETSKQLKEEYAKIARKHHVSFMAASDFAKPSPADQEHLDLDGHRILADKIYEWILGLTS